MAEKKKLESTFLNMVVVLLLIGVGSALALGFTYNFTKEDIAKVKQAKIENSLGEVLPEFDNKEEYTVDGFDDLTLYKATKNGEFVGTAVKSYSDGGFTERIWLMVGFDKDDKVYKVSVVEQKETPGLGTKMVEPKFKDQFNGKDPSGKLKVKNDGGDIDSITAATISSRAFCDAVNRAYDALSKGGKK